jgi:ubiquinone/menaquinone biosynthesis C-methylase UbiE
MGENKRIMINELKFTGERMVTSVNATHGVIEHLHRYAMALQFINDKVVLDLASGEGYGAFLMSKHAKKVYGVDIDVESVIHAKKKYNSCTNLEFYVGAATSVPLPDKSVDVVTSFETLEHLIEHDEMVKEITRVLKKDGCLLISSPEKSIYKKRDAKNPFHLRELTMNELKELLQKYFTYNIFFNQRFVFGSLIHMEHLNTSSEFQLYDGNYNGIHNTMEEDNLYNRAFYNLALCSNIKNDHIKLIGNSFFNGLDVLKKELKDANEAKDKLLNTTSFKVGAWIVNRLRFLKKLKGK